VSMLVLQSIILPQEKEAKEWAETLRKQKEEAERVIQEKKLDEERRCAPERESLLPLSSTHRHLSSTHCHLSSTHCPLSSTTQVLSRKKIVQGEGRDNAAQKSQEGRYSSQFKNNYFAEM